MHADTRKYNATQPPDERKICELLAREIDRNLPEAENKIWHAHPVKGRLKASAGKTIGNGPGKAGGQYVVYFAGWKHHWSLYPVTEPVRSELGSELASYKLSKGTVRFPLADPLPEKLVRRIVAKLARATEAREQLKIASPSGK